MTETDGHAGAGAAAEALEVDPAEVDRMIETIGRKPDRVLPLLQAIQERWRYLPEAALRRVAERTEIRPADLIGVSTFFPYFRHAPMGRHTVRVCVGTACHVKGAERVHEAVARHLGLGPGEDTDAARRFTVQKVACLGCCTLAPVVQVDDVTYGHLRPDESGRMLEAHAARAGAAPPPAPAGRTGGERGEIRVGLGSCCIAGGSAAVRDELLRTLAEFDIRAAVRPVGCVGMCHRTPLLEFVPPGREPAFYSKVRPEDVRSLVLRHFPPAGAWRRARAGAGRWLDGLLAGPDANPARALDVRDPPVAAFLGPQFRIATEQCGALTPTDLDDYRRGGGFQALDTALRRMTPEAVIDEIRRSGLRGRGGAGFWTGQKWALVRATPGPVKYVICNGDEGDPGAFMDRMIMESYPYRVLEGMILAAYAVGARQGFLYIRAEYALAVRRIRHAIDRCRAVGLLGERLLGTSFSLDLEIRQGAGAFVCGEETALIASIEGRRGMPALRPPYPAHQGLWGRPTLVGNCETLAMAPWILRHGAEAFAAIGTERNRGTKVFALAGKVARGGLIEVPMGLTIRRIVEEIGGGVAGGRAFKAVQIGGPSGGCLPARMADIPVDYEALVEAGAMMGSGGLVVLDDADCMVDMARYFLSFSRRESCGKCTPCRIGTQRLLEILDRLCEGRARPDDLARLEALARRVRSQSLCGLGKTAPNPVLTTLEYFRDEYEAHLAGRCPAGKCRALVSYRISDRCIGCTRCAQACPVAAIPLHPYRRHEILDDRCTRCDTCRQVCPAGAVEIVDRAAAAAGHPARAPGGGAPGARPDPAPAATERGHHAALHA